MAGVRAAPFIVCALLVAGCGPSAEERERAMHTECVGRVLASTMADDLYLNTAALAEREQLVQAVDMTGCPAEFMASFAAYSGAITTARLASARFDEHQAGREQAQSSSVGVGLLEWAMGGSTGATPMRDWNARNVQLQAELDDAGAAVTRADAALMTTAGYYGIYRQTPASDTASAPAG